MKRMIEAIFILSGMLNCGLASARFIQADPVGVIPDPTPRPIMASDVLKYHQLNHAYAYVSGDPLRYVDPYGLLNVLVGGGGSYVLGGGAEASAGVALNPGLGDDCADAGVFGSYGVGGGLNISGDAFIGFVTGPISNVAGPTNNSNLALGPISITVFYAPNGSGPIGGTIGLGPSLLPIGGSATLSNTGVLSLRGPSKSQACGCKR